MKQKRLQVNIPEKLYKAMKYECVKRDISMKSLIMGLISTQDCVKISNTQSSKVVNPQNTTMSKVVKVVNEESSKPTETPKDNTPTKEQIEANEQYDDFVSAAKLPPATKEKAVIDKKPKEPPFNLEETLKDLEEPEKDFIIKLTENPSIKDKILNSGIKQFGKDRTRELYDLSKGKRKSV